jgi:hypothetical protein
MMTGLRLRDERNKRRARVGAFITLTAVTTVTLLLQPGYQWVSLAVGGCTAIALAVSGDLPGGTKRGRVSGFIGSGTIIISGLFPTGWQWMPFAVGVSAAVALFTIGDRAGGRRRGGHGSLRGRGRDDDDGPSGSAGQQWRMLAMASRLMPGPAGRRWLAEAESLLSEIAADQRGSAARSYLLSAPGLAVMMWAHEAQRRARPGSRRPG